MVAQLQVTVPADCEQLPLPTGVVAETNVELTGIVLFSPTRRSSDLPLFVNCTKNWTSPVPSVIGSGETLMLEMARSIWELTVTALLPLLLEVFGSDCVAETVDVRLNEPAAVGVTVMYA